MSLGKIVNIFTQVISIKWIIPLCTLFTATATLAAQPVIGGQNPATQTDYGNLYSYDLSASDADGDPLTYDVVTWPEGTGITISSTGVVEWTPIRDEVGKYWISVGVTDGTGAPVRYEYELTVIDPNNQLPVIGQQPLTSTNYNEVYSYNPQASDADGDSLTYVFWTWPDDVQGISVDSNGNVSWTPDRDDVGTYYAGIIVDDGHLGEARVDYELTVNDPNNQLPVINQQPLLQINHGETYTYDPQATDGDGDALTFQVHTSPDNTGLTISSSGVVNWVPQREHTGLNVIEIVIEDGYQGQTRFEYVLSVLDPNNQQPFFTSVPVTSAIVNEVYQYTSQATDPDGDALNYSLFAGPAGMTVDAASGLVEWTPIVETTAPGERVKIIVADDFGGSALQDYYIMVSAGSGSTNTAPVAIDDAVTTDQNTPVAITLQGTDSDGDTLSYSIVSAPVSGQLSGTLPNLSYTPNTNFNGPDSFTFRVNDGQLDSALAAITIDVQAIASPLTIVSVPVTTASVGSDYSYQVLVEGGDSSSLEYDLYSDFEDLRINSSGLVSWSVGAGYEGSHQITIIVVDDMGGSSSQPYTLVVTNPNVPPVAQDQSLSLAEDTSISIPLAATDADGDALSYTMVGTPNHGVLTSSGLDTLIYTPSANFNGSDSFTFFANDGQLISNSATVFLTVTPVNDPPVIMSTALLTAQENIAYSTTVTATDIDGDALTYSLVSGPIGMVINSATGFIDWLPGLDMSGDHSVTVAVSDGQGGSDTDSFVITVANTNQAPQALPDVALVDEDSSVTITLNGSDPDNDLLTYTITNLPAHGSVSGDGTTYTYIPNANYFGADSFQFIANDGVLDSAPAVVSITVSSLNDIPQFQYSPNLTAEENLGYNTTVLAIDADGDPLSYGLGAAPAGMTINSTTGDIYWVPDYDDAGGHSVTVTVDDGQGGSNSDQFIINVANTNRAPGFTSSPLVDGEEDLAYSYDVNASDPDGDTVSYSLQQAPADMSIDPDVGLINWLPSASDRGANSIIVAVTDGQLVTTQSYTLTIAFANAAPVITSTPVYSVPDGQAYQYSVVGIDPNGDLLTYTLSTAPSGVYWDQADNSIKWDQAVSGSYPVTLEVSDPAGLVALQSYVLEVVSPEPPETTEGRDFWLMFNSTLPPPNYRLYIVSEQDTEATIEIPGASYSATYTVTANQVLTVDLTTILPSHYSVELGILPWGIHVTAPDDISVYLINDAFASADAAQVYPTRNLGTEYIALGDAERERLLGIYIPFNNGNFLGVVATEDNTVIDITPTIDIYLDHAHTDIREAGQTFQITLNQGEVYQAIGGPRGHSIGVNTETDISGSLVVADKPVAVFAGDNCRAAGSNEACDHIVEQMLPIISWGVKYHTLPLAGRARGDRFKIYAGYDNTHIWINGELMAGVHKGEYIDAILEEPSIIEGNQPIAVMQIAHADNYDTGVRSLPVESADPFMTTVPPEEQFLSSYVFTSAGDHITYHFINVIVPVTAVDSFILDGSPIDASLWEAMPDSRFMGAKIPVAAGQHQASADRPFGLYVYGFGFYVSYGYLGGLALADNQQASELLVEASSLTPQVGESLCLSAQLLTATQQPVSQTQVFYTRTVQGIPRPYASLTDVAGQTGLCFDGESNGTETLLVNAQGLSQTLTIDWQPYAGGDSAPQFYSLPVTSATAGQSYSYQAFARDPNQDAISYALTEAPPGMTIDAITGLISWQAPVDFDRASIVIQASDGALITEQAYELRFTLKSNRYPIINSVPITAITSGQEFRQSISATDIDGHSMTYQLVSGPPGMALENTNVLVWQTSDADVGNHPVSLTVTDQLGLVTAQDFVLTVNLNVPPVINSTPPSHIEAGHDWYYPFTVEDSNGDVLTYQLNSGPEGMIVNYTGYARWFPTADQVGVHQAEIQVQDGSGSFATQQITVTVTPNSLPVFNVFPAQNAITGHAYNSPIVASDLQGDYLVYSVVSGPAGLTTYGASVRWTPDFSQVGTHPVTIMVADPYGGSATYSYDLVVVPNSFPQFTSTPSQAAVTLRPYSYTTLYSDAEGDAVQFSLVSGPAGMTRFGNTINWTPTETQVGSHTVVLELNDQRGGITTQTFSISVTQNQAPAFTSSPVVGAVAGELYQYQAAAIDGDSDPIAFQKILGPTSLFVSSTGLVSWTPQEDDEGTHAIIIEAYNTGANSLATRQSFDITVINETLTLVDYPIAPQLLHYQPWSFTALAVHPDALPITYTLTGAVPAGLSIDANSGLIAWTPGFDQIGEHVITLTADDGNGQQDSVSVTLTVQQGANQPPDIQSSPELVAYVDEQYNYQVAAVDPEGQPLAYTLLDGPPAMSVSASGLIGWLSTAAEVGSYPITVLVDDGQGGEALQDFTLQVVDGRDFPTIISEPVTQAFTETGYSYQLQALDPESDPLSYAVTSGPAGLVIDNSGLATWSPTFTDIGLHTVTLTVSDDQGHSTPQTYVIRVTAPGPYNRRQCR